MPLHHVHVRTTENLKIYKTNLQFYYCKNASGLCVIFFSLISVVSNKKRRTKKERLGLRYSNQESLMDNYFYFISD